ncbi:hypothetical protein NIES4072_37380 [Nostoc commune NIES-4072]|uniref:Uncharacterized protein n=1 Tax=Nostoc commune NIES-4072 TaxID=2005467 RepID=A0A2R5FPV8_NOSCO|nr:hypothetical protein NIES4070_53380 [Nostoc commune HK-02]GBG20069.1 hypothetical protein NIES4072_37380 [Nostoc commune NIES-4072]
MLVNVAFRCFFHAVKKAVMHSRYLAKVNCLGIKPQTHADNLSVFICGFLFAKLDFFYKSNVQYKKAAIMQYIDLD